jgi:hypothetical protein
LSMTLLTVREHVNTESRTRCCAPTL